GRFVTGAAASPDRSYQVNGHLMYLAGPGRYPPVDMVMDRFEQGTTLLFEQEVHRGMVVLDIGAHAGYYSLLSARQAGSTGKVYAFEPEPSNHGLLVRNIEGNGYQNIVTVNKAVTNKVGTSTLFVTSLDNGSHSLYQHGLPEDGRIEVETTTVDAFLELQGWPSVGLVKLDVEGAESDALDGMAELFNRSPKLKMIIEFNPCLLTNAGIDPRELIGKLHEGGFNVQKVDEKKGTSAIESAELVPLVKRLTKGQGSLNLFCSRQ
ncbi:MAG: FkbM family methyltransferase, partial [Opitutales bacterium]